MQLVDLTELVFFGVGEAILILSDDALFDKAAVKKLRSSITYQSALYYDALKNLH